MFLKEVSYSLHGSVYLINIKVKINSNIVKYYYNLK